MNFVCIVFELGDKTLTLSSMENLIVPCNQVNKYGIPIMPCTPVFTAGPDNPGRQVGSLTGGQEQLTLMPCSPVDLSTLIDRLTGGQERLTHNALHSYIYLSTFQPW